MNKQIKTQIKDKFPEILTDEHLNKYCTFMIGGPADLFYKAKTTEKLIEIINFAKQHQIPLFIMAGGSNLLFDDKGFRGLVVKIETDQISTNKDTITADSGVMISRLIKESIQADLSGLEKWLGLPGTVGGAVRGNAGCNGLETAEILQKALLLDPSTAETQTVTADFFQYHYRHSTLKDSDQIVLQATFKLKKDALAPEEQQKIMDEIRKFRLTKQPFGKSSGSFFKNPSAEKPAGLLIDQAGIKGHTIGKAQISEKHGNFFLNLGGATADDMKRLAKYAIKAVQKKFNIALHEEVQIISEHGKTNL